MEPLTSPLMNTFVLSFKYLYCERYTVFLFCLHNIQLIYDITK